MIGLLGILVRVKKREWNSYMHPKKALSEAKPEKDVQGLELNIWRTRRCK